MRVLMIRILIVVMICTLGSLTAYGFDPLEPVKTDTPQDTVRTFMRAMKHYRDAVKDQDDHIKYVALDRAVRTLDTSYLPVVVRKDAGREAAIFLKEVIDRLLLIDYNRIPPGKDDPNIRSPWRLKDSEIKIVKVEKGDRKGEYLFSSETVSRVKEFYNLLKDRPYVKGASGAGYEAPWLQEKVPDWLKGSFFGIWRWQFLGAFFAIFIGLLFRRLIFWLINFLGSFASRSKSRLDDKVLAVIPLPASWVGASAFWFVAIAFLRFEGIVLSTLNTLVQIIFSFSLVWSFYRMAAVLSDYVKVAAEKTNMGLDEQLVPIISKSMRIFVVLVGSLVAFQNLGINVMSLVAGLGLGGLAFALAAKDTAANLFGSVMIFSDSPFRIGDWVKFSNVEGTVENIGFRSTKVRTFYNSLITVPNATVASVAVDNMGRRRYRRVHSTLGLTYDTSPDEMEAFLEGVKNIIKANPSTRKDYFHVVFSGYRDSHLEVMLYFFLEVPDWSQELVQRQNIYLEVLRLAKELKISFAFPTQTLHVESLPSEGKIPRQPLDSTVLASCAKEFGKGGSQASPGGRGIFTPPFLEV